MGNMFTRTILTATAAARVATATPVTGVLSVDPSRRQLDEVADPLHALGVVDAGLQACLPGAEHVEVDCQLDPAQHVAGVTYTAPQAAACDGYSDYMAIYSIDDVPIVSGSGGAGGAITLRAPYSAEQTGEIIAGSFRVYIGHYEDETTQGSGAVLSFIGGCTLTAGELAPQVIADPGPVIGDDQIRTAFISVVSETFVNRRDRDTGVETNYRGPMTNAMTDRPGWIISFGSDTHAEHEIVVRHMTVTFPDGRTKTFMHNGEKHSNDLLKVAYPDGSRSAFVVIEQQAEAHIDPLATTIQFSVLITMGRPDARLGIGVNEANPMESEWLENVGLAASGDADSGEGRRMQEQEDAPREVQVQATYPQLQDSAAGAQTSPAKASSAAATRPLIMPGAMAALLTAICSSYQALLV